METQPQESAKLAEITPIVILVPQQLLPLVHYVQQVGSSTLQVIYVLKPVLCNSLATQQAEFAKLVGQAVRLVLQTLSVLCVLVDSYSGVTTFAMEAV